MKKLDGLLKRSKLILLTSVILIIAGIFAYDMIPKQKMPDMAPPIGSYRVMALGYSAEEIHELVVEPMTSAISSVVSDADVSTTSFDNFALVNIILDTRERNPDEVWDEIAGEISGINFPENVFPPEFQDKFEFPHAIYSIAFSNDDEERVIVENLVDDIDRLDEVSSVVVSGLSSEQVVIDIKMNRLNELPMTAQTIMDLVFANGMDVPIGKLNSINDSISVEIPMQYNSIDEIKNIIVGQSMTDNTIIRLEDVADIRLEPVQTAKEFYSLDDEIVLLSVFLEDKLDVTDLGEELTGVIDEFSDDHPSVEIESMIFQPDAVSDSIDVVNKSLIQGVIFVLIVIFIGLGFRNALSVAVTFPLIIFTTILVLFTTGQQLQMISITGLIITIGIIVDNAIVISESIQFHLDQDKKMNESIILSLKQNAGPILASTLTTVAAFIPLLMMEGAAGKLMFALPFTVIVAILLSYVSAMIVTPVLGKMLYKKKKKRVSLPFGHMLRDSVSFALKQPLLIVVLSILLLVGSLFAVAVTSPIELFPTAEESVLYINYKYNEMDYEGLRSYTDEILSIVNDLPDVDYVSYSVGGDLPRFDTSVDPLDELPNIGRFFIRFDMPYEELEETKEELISNLEDLYDKGRTEVKELMFGPSGEGIEVNISSYDSDVVESWTKILESDINDIEDVEYVIVNYPVYDKAYVIDVNRDELSQAGVMAMELQNQLRYILGNNNLGTMIHEDTELIIVGKTSIDSKYDLENVGILSSRTGEKSKLRDLGHINEDEKLLSKSTQNGEFLLSITVIPYDEENTTAIQAEIENIVSDYDLDDIEVNYGGEKELRSDSFSSIAQAAIIAIVLIYLIMLTQFGSFRQPFIVLMTIPLSLIGSAIAVMLFRVPITFTIMLGFVALMGIVVNSGILLIDYINNSREQGMTLEEACITSVERRIRPITLSSVTTILGLVPLALYGGSFFAPLAVTFMGGLAVATLMTIFVIPALYFLFEKKKKKNGLSDDQLILLKFLEEKQLLKEANYIELLDDIDEQ